MIVPINKYLAQDYRRTLSTGGAPQMIDDSNPIIPVIDVQKGFITPNSKQLLKKYTVVKGAAAGAFNIALSTPSLSKKVYLVGYRVNITGAAGIMALYDSTTDGDQEADADSVTINRYASATTNEIFNFQIPIPIEKRLLLYVNSGAASGVTATIYYIDETVD